MALTANEVHDGQTAQFTAMGARYTRQWKVVFPSPPASDDKWASDAIAATGIPSLNDAHPQDANAKCNDVMARHMDQNDPQVWLVAAIYGQPQGGPIDDDPLNDPVQKRYWFREMERFVDKGNFIDDGIASSSSSGTGDPGIGGTGAGGDNDPVVNSAGDGYEGGIAIPEFRLMLTIVRNEATFAPATANSYMGSVNNGNVTIVGLALTARQAKLINYAGEFATRNGDDYWIVTYEMEFKADKHDAQIADEGYYIKDASGNRIPVTRGGEAVQQPVKLDGAAGTLPDGNPVVFRTYRFEAETDFSALSLPTS